MNPRQRVQTGAGFVEEVREAGSTLEAEQTKLSHGVEAANPPTSKSLYKADSIAKSLAVNTLASVINRALGLGRMVGLAWLMPKDQFGLFNVGLLVSNVALPICSLGLHDGAARYAPIFEAAGRRRAFLRRLFLLVVLIVPALSWPMLVFADALGPLVFSAIGRMDAAAREMSAGAASSLMKAVCAYVVCLSVFFVITNTFKGLRMFRLLSYVDVTVGALFTLVALAAAAMGFDRAAWMLVIAGLSCLVPGLLFAPGLLRGDGVRAESAIVDGRSMAVGPMLRFSAWTAASAMVWNVLNAFPSWYLLKMVSVEAAATMAGVRTVTQVVQLGATIVGNNVSANVIGLWEMAGREPATVRMHLLTRLALMALFAGGVVTSLLAWPIMKLFPETYAAGLSAYDPMVLFYLLVGLVGIVAIRLHVIHRPSLVLVGWVAGAVVNIGLTHVLVRRAVAGVPFDEGAALAAAAWAGAAGALISVGVCVILSGRRNLPLDPRSLVLAACLLTVGLGWRISGPILLLITLLSVTSNILFTAEERRTVYGSLRTAIGR